MAIPKLSVVIASDNTKDRTLECLATLRAQAAPGDVQIIVADCSRDGTMEAITRQASDVEAIHFPQRETLPTLLAAGLRRARGEMVAILESRGIPEAGWVDAVLATREEPNAAVGGTVEFAGSRRLVDWAAYFCDYGQFMRPRAAGVVSELPGNNCAFPRALLEKCPEYVQPGFWKTFFLWQLQEREGVWLLSSPAMVVRYHREFPTLTDFLTRRFHHARCFGAMRRRRLSMGQRWIYTLLAPLLPPLLMGRILRHNLSKRRHRDRLWRALPIIMLASLVWAAGEWMGYVANEGGSCGRMH